MTWGDTGRWWDLPQDHDNDLWPDCPVCGAKWHRSGYKLRSGSQAHAYWCRDAIDLIRDVERKFQQYRADRLMERKMGRWAA